MARKTSRANKPRRTEGYSIIYVIKSEFLDAHKIGITNDWSRRKRELKVGISTTAVHVARINNAESLETYLHGKFQSSRLPQSEWFRLDENGLAFVRSAIRKAKDDYEHSQKASSSRSSNLTQGRSPSEYSYRASDKRDSAKPKDTETGHEYMGGARTIESPKASSGSTSSYWDDPKRVQKEARFSRHCGIVLVGLLAYPLTGIIRGVVSEELSITGAISYLILLVLTGVPLAFFPACFIAYFTASIHNRIDPID
jgi:hypothetical protein